MSFEVLGTVRLAHEMYTTADPERIAGMYADWTRAQFAHNEAGSTPVLICARNEATDLPGALVGLARSHNPVTPIVIDNGSSDNTAEIAENMGAIVLEEPEAGKTAAFQTGLRFVVQEMPTSSVVLATDADSVVNPSWSCNMQAKAARLQKTGGVTFGMSIVMGGESRTTDAVRSAILNGKQIYAAIRKARPGARGYNTALTLDPDNIVLNSILELPNVFPGSDRAIRHAILKVDGVVQPNIHTQSVVVTRGNRYSSLRQYISAHRGEIPSELIYGSDFVAKYDNAPCG